ncbi:hypothetical protein I79_004377 [Cricetulus griseus]|uniref:Uncharacterized protein n=1 Tax=Cricetulus griseus TaxID=10029 RepID=G3H2G4_CRIGR|nr:hypothetical protein I79_004377 [Cricetulus griseus]
MLGSSLSFTGKSSFLSLCATTRDTDGNAVTVPDQGLSLPSPPVLPSQDVLSGPGTLVAQQHTRF